MTPIIGRVHQVIDAILHSVDAASDGVFVDTHIVPESPAKQYTACIKIVGFCLVRYVEGFDLTMPSTDILRFGIKIAVISKLAAYTQ